MYGGFQLLFDGACVLCRRADVPVLVAAKGEDVSNVGVCEPCARLSDWRFRDTRDAELAGASFPTTPGAALVWIYRERVVDKHPDTLCPYDVLMVGRKDEPGKFGLPGGKLERGETPAAAAVRELGEETSLLAWTTGLDLLYSGFSARGRLVDTFLCRARAGEPVDVEGVGVEWKPWPPSEHVGVLRGYYRGLEHAFEERIKLYKETVNPSPLCQHLGKSAVTYVTEALLGDKRDLQYMDGMLWVMTEEEKQASRIVLSEVNLQKLPEAKQAKAADSGDGESVGEGEGEGEPDGAGGDDREMFNNDERQGPGR